MNEINNNQSGDFKPQEELPRTYGESEGRVPEQWDKHHNADSPHPEIDHLEPTVEGYLNNPVERYRDIIDELPRDYRPTTKIEIVETESIERTTKVSIEQNKDVDEVPNVVKNKLEGCRRENEVKEELEEQYPESEGYKVLPERELCDKDGNPVIDAKTGKTRRIDFVVVKEGVVVDMVEVTSKTAPKLDQTMKEYRIRDNGGNYVKDADGNIYRIPNNVLTRIERRD